jgi:hypothetical protein
VTPALTQLALLVGVAATAVSADDVAVPLPGMSRHPIPGGVAFENFEMRERFRPGQRIVFGITHRTPACIFQRVVDTAEPVPSRPATLRAGAASTPDDASASRRVADVDGVSSDRVLVGVNYFAGWWRPLPNLSEFGEGGTVAPTRGEGLMKLESITNVFGLTRR